MEQPTTPFTDFPVPFMQDLPPDRERATRVMTHLLQSITELITVLLSTNELLRYINETSIFTKIQLNENFATAFLSLKASLLPLLAQLENEYYFLPPPPTPVEERKECRRAAYGALSEAAGIAFGLGEMVRQCEIDGWMGEVMNGVGLMSGSGWKDGPALERLRETHLRLLCLRYGSSDGGAGWWELWEGYVACSSMVG